MGKDETWEELSAYSNSPTQSGQRPSLGLIKTTEFNRLPATPYLFQLVDGTDIKLDPEIIAERETAIADFREEIRKRLAITPRQEVFLFVHGVGNQFDDAVETAAQLWHFLGREGVPIAYTWPAGSEGLFFYAYDRESSDFTIFHLKQFAKILASIPEIERIHVISHSRGTDVSLTALRELVIEARAAGTNPHDLFKIENVVLIAPDLDFEITMQRNVSEGLGAAFGQMTIYTSTDDGAMNAAKTLFSSRVRLGSTQPEDLTEQQRATLRRQHNLDFVIYQGQFGGSFGHSYAVDNPAVGSDIVALLRYGKAPGKENGRPLEHLGENFWLLTDNYMEAGASQ